MKATGVIRRIDDLGRIVIPKEIRRNLSIREGDPFEICLDGDIVCFKKYDPDPACGKLLVDTLDRIREEYDLTNQPEICKKLQEAIDLLEKGE